jgi:hypothetical protein
MNATTPKLAKGIEIATAFVQREVKKRTRLNPEGCNPEEIWASLTHDGRIFIGTPLLRTGQGFYVDYRGRWQAA